MKLKKVVRSLLIAIPITYWVSPLPLVTIYPNVYSVLKREDNSKVL